MRLLLILSGLGWRGRERALSRYLALLSLGLFCASAQAHPEGRVDCRADIRLEAGRFQSMRAELWLDQRHSDQAFGQVRAKDSKKIDPKRMELLADSLRAQFARYQWLFDLKADGQALATQLKAPPTVEFMEGRLRLLIDQVASNPLPAKDLPIPKLWTISCFDPTYYWATAFRKSAPTSNNELTKRHGDDYGEEKGSTPDPLTGHRSIKVDPSAQDPLAVQVSGCTARRPALAQDGVQPPRGGVAQLDWVCQP